MSWRLAALLVMGLVLSGCATVATTPTAPTGPQSLTTEQAQRFAIARFTNYDEGTRAVSATIGGGDALELTGWVDFADHQGYVTATDTTSGGPLGLLHWTLTTLSVIDSKAGEAPLPVPQTGWISGDLDPADSALNTVLATLLSLGNDRPDNPTLLQQSNALWLRADTVDGTPVDVFAGPSSDDARAGDANAATVRYWIDNDGRLLRLELETGTAPTSVIDFGDAVSVDVMMGQ